MTDNHEAEGRTAAPGAQPSPAGPLSDQALEDRASAEGEAPAQGPEAAPVGVPATTWALDEPLEPAATTRAPEPASPLESEDAAPGVAPRARPRTRRATTQSAPRKAPASPAAKRARESGTPAGPRPARPATLAIDVGGTGLKASVLDAAGKLMADRVRVLTTYPCPPEALVDTLVALVAPLPAFDRVSIGFPGVVRKGIVLTAPHFVTRSGPGSAVVPKLQAAWARFDLAGALSARLGHPVRVANDADLQGLEVVSGEGLEFVVTLGTGVGTALFVDGKLAPHLELAHHPFRKGETYNEQLGEAALRKIGAKRWRKRAMEAFDNFSQLLNYDRLYVAGGNARLLAGHVDASVTIVDNVAGILGGIKLWEVSEL